MPFYRVYTKHDHGTARTVTFAQDAETAAHMVTTAAGAPARAAYKVTEVKPRKYTTA
jgi:hypothetical protein